MVLDGDVPGRTEKGILHTYTQKKEKTTILWSLCGYNSSKGSNLQFCGLMFTKELTP